MTEANPFSPDVLAKEAGLPVVDKSSSNPFAEFSTSTFVADDQEQRVIAAVNNPSISSPRNFGLVEIPATIANEMDRSLFSIPRDIGSTLLEAGELSQSMKGKTTAEIAMNSAQKRLVAAMRADSEPGLFGSDYLKIPSSYRLLGALWGVEKDVVLSTVSDGTVPTSLINTGNAMMEQNRIATEALLGKPKSGIYADVGSGVGSVFKSIGAWYITKNPEAAGAYMSWTVNSNDYLEARAADKTPEEAAAIAGVSALGQGKIEGIGMKVFAGAAATSGFFRRILFRAAEQSAEESAQGVVEETVKGASGVRDTSFDDKLHNVLYQGALGFIVGAPVATVFSVMEKTATDSGLDPADIKRQMESFVKNKDKVVSGAVDLINKEMSDVTNNPADLQKAKQRMKEVLAADSANEQAATDQDPKAAARVLLKTASAELRSAIESLPTGFTMEQLNEAVNSPEVLADTAMANSLALAEKQSSKWQALKEAFTGSVSDIISARSLTKKQVMETQNRIIETINQSELPAEDKGKFLVAVRDTQTADQLVRRIDDINARIDKLVDSSKRKIAVSRIKATAKKAGNSSVVAVDIAKRIGQLAEEIDLQNRNPATIKSLQKTMDYLNSNPDADLPPAMLKQLDILNKKPLADVTTKELTDLADKLDTLVVRGKARLALIKEKAEDLKRERLASIEKTAAPLSSKPIARANIGESLSTMDNIKNRYNELLNGASEIGIALNPMDVFFDMLDGAKNYNGNVYKVFKKTIDTSFSEYLNLKEEMTREVKSLSDKLNLNEKNYEKIGAWAVLQQQGGEKKLLDTGISQAEIDGLSLTPQETQMYQLMRTKLDSMRPAIKDIMRRVYNKDFTEVDDYFPFLTDHEAMEELSIQDQIGDGLPSISKRKNVEKGFTKARTGGKQKVRIDAMGVFLKHMDNATYLVKMGEDIKALGDVATDSKYGAAVGDLGQKMTVEWIDLLARKGAATGRIVGLDILRRNIGAAVLGFKLSSIFVQPTSLADGASLVGGNYVRRGVASVTNTEWRQFLWDNMPEIRERAGDDPAYLNMGGESILANVREAGFLALKFVDALSASSVAIGAYTKSVEQRGGEVDLTKPDKQAIQEAQLMMRRTQASAFSKDAPPVITQGKLTGSVSLDKLILQFQSFMLNRWSVLRHDLWRVGIRGGETKQAVNIATWMMIAAAGELMSRRLAVELIGSFFGNEPEKWDKTVNKEAVGIALGSVPFVSQAVSALQYGSVPVPSLSIINRVIGEANTAAKTKDEAKKNKHIVRAVLLGVGATFGVPGTLQAEALLKEKKK